MEEIKKETEQIEIKASENPSSETKKPTKKEVQGTIIPQINTNNGKISEEEFFAILKTVSPGTNLRTALEGILKTESGALIVLGNEQINSVIDGGFRVNCRFTPQRLIELSKMDGAIILSKDAKKIEYANVLLTPDNKIKTLETGTRHKAAERTAKQTGALVIAISERKNEISIFYKNVKHPLRNTEFLLRRSNEHLHLLEKQRELFDINIEKLNKLELKNYPSLHKAIGTIQKGRLIQKIAEGLRKNIIELGNEGTLIKTRLKEITKDVERETNLIIKDYTNLDLKKSKLLLETLTYDEILDENNIVKALAYEKILKNSPIKGWRILSKTTLAESDIALLVKQLGTLGKAVHSNVNEFKPILGEEKALSFKEEIDKIKLNP